MLRLRKRWQFLALSLLLVCLLALPISAEQASTDQLGTVLPEEYLTFVESLPPEVQALLPEGLFSTDAKEVEAALTEMSDFSYLLRTGLSMLGLELFGSVRLLFSVCGVLILSAVFSTVKTSLQGKASAKAFSFCTTLVMLLTLVSVGFTCMSSVGAYFERLLQFTTPLIPLTSALYAMGGNVTTAMTSTSTLSIFMVLMETLVGRSVLPFCSICLGGATVSALNSSLRLGTLLTTLKRSYTTLLAFLMMLLLAMLAMQSTLGSRADTLAMKSAKFAAGNLIPVLGGSVSELLRSLGAGVSYLRSTVGICALLLLLLMLFPTLIRLFLYRTVFLLGASIADLLSCDTEKKLLDEFASIGGFLITAVCICSGVLILSLSLFIHSASAIG
ncbi:MAG: hypothetical protein IKC31_05210 [Clostridia bacterium]|nr:hypothetical protein [Clostridia bacterium]